MSLLENLAQGFAGAAGATDAAQSIQRNKDDRRATAHEELEAKSKMIWDDVKRLQDRRASLDPKSPTYAKDVSDIDASLKAHQGAFTDLYHPEKNPGALQHLGRFLRSHLTGQKAPVPTSPGEAKQSMAQLQAGAAGPGQTPENPYLTKKRQMTEAGGTPEQIERGVFGSDKAEPESWKLVDVVLPDGSHKTVQHNEKDRTFSDLAGNPIPQETLAGAQLSPKGSAHPIRAWVNKNGKPTSVLLDPATNQVIPGSENPNIQPPSSMSGRISTGYYHFVDENGNVHQVQETHTSTPMGSGGSPSSPTKPSTPGELKAKSKPATDNVIGHKETPVQAKAHNTYIAAYQLSQAADLVANEPDNAQGQKSLAVALERAAAGRFTTQALDYINKAGWSAGAEQFWRNIDNGTLPAVVMKNLIQRAHDNKDAAYAAWQESNKGSETSGDSDVDAIVHALKNAKPQ